MKDKITVMSSRAKTNDILLLFEIFKMLDEFTNKKIDLKQVIEEIGKIKISYNDKDGAYIRNQYGYINRSNNNQINEKGIPFEKLYNLSLFLKVNPNHNGLESEEANISDDLIALKSKIKFIIEKEKAVLEVDKYNEIQAHPGYAAAKARFDKKLDDLINISENLFDRLILQRIGEELQNLSRLNFDFSNKNHRYYLARTLTKVGELAHEYVLYKDKKSNPQLKGFVNLNSLRDVIVHADKKIREGSQNYKQINECITSMIETFKEVIDVENGALKGSSDGFNNSTKALLDLLKMRATVITEQKDKEEVKQAKVSKETNPESKLQGIIRGYCQKLEEKEHNPNKDYSRIFSNITNEYNKLRPQVANDIYPDDIASSTITELQGYIKDIVKKQEASKEKLMSKKEQERDEKLRKIISRIDNEIDYLLKMTTDNNIDPEEKNYIIEHIITVVGEYSRSIQDPINGEEIKELSSQVASSAFKETIRTKNSSLAHDIFSFAQEDFNKVVQDSIVPANTDFKAISYILERKKATDANETARCLMNLGKAYQRLGHFSKSEEYLKRTVMFIKNNPKKVEEEKLRECGITGGAILIDLDEVTLGIDSFKLETASYLINSLIHQGKLGEAESQCTSLLDQINYDEVHEASNKYFQLILNAALPLINILKSQCLNYDVLIKRILNLIPYLNPEHRNSCYLTLANLYIEQDHKEKASLMMSFLDEEGQTPLNKINHLLLRISLCEPLKDPERSSKLMKEANLLIESNAAKWKEEYGDQYLQMTLQFISHKLEHKRKLNLLFNEAAIKELEEEAQSILKLLRNEFKHSSSEIGLYCRFSKSYIDLLKRESNPPDAFKYIRRSMEYLEKTQSAHINDVRINETAKVLAIAISNYAQRSSLNNNYNLQMNLLERAVDIQRRFKVHNPISDFNLGVCYGNYAIVTRNKSITTSLSLFNKSYETLISIPREIVSQMDSQVQNEYTYALNKSYREIQSCEKEIKKANMRSI